MDKTEVVGMEGIKEAFAELKGDTTKISRRMVVAGGKLIRDRAKQNAQQNKSVISGAMVDNIAIKRESKSLPGIVQYHIGVRSGREQSRKTMREGKTKLVISKGRITTRRSNNPFYWKFVERGHKVTPASAKGGFSFFTQRLRDGTVAIRRRRYSANSLRSRRRSAEGRKVGEKPFLQPALEQERATAIAAMRTTLDRYLARERKRGK